MYSQNNTNNHGFGRYIQPGEVMGEATEAATESADTAVTGPTLFLFFTATALIAFAILRLTPLYKK